VDKYGNSIGGGGSGGGGCESDALPAVEGSN